MYYFPEDLHVQKEVNLVYLRQIKRHFLQFKAGTIVPSKESGVYCTENHAPYWQGNPQGP